MSWLWLLSLSLVALACYLDSCIKIQSPPLTNDDYSEFFDPERVWLPHSEADIIRLVKKAANHHQQLRVLGSGHSRNSLSLSRDVILSLQHYKGVVSLDRQAREVTVRAGSTLKEVANYLDEQGLALGVLPAILEQTVAGAISTGTHGSRSEYGNLATLVRRLRLVTAEGKVLTLSAEDTNTDFFHAAQVSLGMLGVIVEVTLQCEPSFTLKETFEKSSMAACLPHLNDIASSAEHVKLWLEIYSKSCDIYRFNRTTKDEDMNLLIWRNLKMHMWEPFLWLSSWLPPLAPTLIGSSVVYGGVFYPEYSQVGRSFEILTVPLYVPRNKQTEFAVAKKDCASALTLLEREMMKWRLASVFIEVRFVQGDDIWLSMNYGCESCHITVIIYNPSDHTKEAFFTALYQTLRDEGLKPRPHFGKYFNVTTRDLGGIYPKYSDFKRVRKDLDPKGVFLNDMVAKFF